MDINFLNTYLPNSFLEKIPMTSFDKRLSTWFTIAKILIIIINLKQFECTHPVKELA